MESAGACRESSAFVHTVCRSGGDTHGAWRRAALSRARGDGSVASGTGEQQKIKHKNRNDSLSLTQTVLAVYSCTYKTQTESESKKIISTHPFTSRFTYCPIFMYLNLELVYESNACGCKRKLRGCGGALCGLGN